MEAEAHPAADTPSHKLLWLTRVHTPNSLSRLGRGVQAFIPAFDHPAPIYMRARTHTHPCNHTLG